MFAATEEKLKLKSQFIVIDELGLNKRFQAAVVCTDCVYSHFMSYPAEVPQMPECQLWFDLMAETAAECIFNAWYLFSHIAELLTLVSGHGYVHIRFALTKLWPASKLV